MPRALSRRVTWVFAALCAVGGVAVGLAAQPAPPDAKAKPAGQKYALLVGVREYDPTELKSLAYPEADMTALAEVLKGQGYRPEHVVLMTHSAKPARFQPFAANVRKELRNLLALCEEPDSLVIALAGHGVQFRGEEEVFFCPADAKLGDKKTLVSLNEVYKELEQCKAGFKLLLVDACRNDPQSNASRSRAEVDVQSVTRPQLAKPPGGVAAFFSCSEGEKAFEHDDLKHGVFFHFVVKGLQGEAAGKDGTVTLPDLERYVKQEVKAYTFAKFGVAQRPDIVNRTRDLVPIVTGAKKPPAGPGPAAPTGPAADARKGPAVDLIQLVDVKRDRRRGTWLRPTEKRLRGYASAKDDYFGLVLPWEPPPEYRISLTVARVTSNPGQLALALAGGKARFNVLFDQSKDGKFYTGLGNLDGKSLPARADARLGAVLPHGVAMKLAVQVETGGVTVLANGHRIYTWQGDLTKSVRSPGQGDVPLAIGGVYPADFMFEDIVLEPLGRDAGRPLGAAPGVGR